MTPFAPILSCCCRPPSSETTCSSSPTLIKSAPGRREAFGGILDDEIGNAVEPVPGDLLLKFGKQDGRRYGHVASSRKQSVRQVLCYARCRRRNYAQHPTHAG